MADQPVNPIVALRAEAKRIEEDSLHSAKGHWEAARSWGHRHLWIGVPTTVLAAISGVSALAQYETLGGVLALSVAALTALFTFLNPSEKAAAHTKAGNAYKALSNDSRIFHEIACLEPTSSEALTKQLLALNERRNALNAESPQIPRGAFERGRKGIQAGEASYAVDQKRKGAVRP